MSKHIQFQPKVHHPLQGRRVSISEFIQFIVEDFLSTPLTDRLEKLSDRLKSTDAQLAKSIINIKAEFERGYWGEATCKDNEWLIEGMVGGKASADFVKNEDGSVRMPTVMFHVDAHIESNLPSAIRALLYQQMIEALLGANQTPERYQGHMRRAAGLKIELAADTERFLTRLHQRLYADERKKWLNIHAGGSKSQLTPYIYAICFHVERLHPICKEAKKLYREKKGGEAARKAVLYKYRHLGEGERWATKPEYVGFPNDLFHRLGMLKPPYPPQPNWVGSPRNIAIAWAAYLCGFPIGKPGVKRIKDAMADYKRNAVGEEYYNQLFKNSTLK
ncbi:MAG: hypothetical protein QOJ02_1264 [Acidobacteriota bacterium]|nr:hypothetical protein [Acidobacteriota bacterium]